MKRQSPIRPAARQQGAALLLFVFLVTIAALTLLVGKLDSVAINAERTAAGSRALLDGKNALLGQLRSSGGPDYWGLLPLPDMGKRDASPHVEGESATNFGADAARGLLANATDALLIGRLPAKSLGISVLRDRSGECLWYAVGAAFKSTNAGVPGFVPSFNWDTLGDFDTGSSDNPHEGRPVALILAAGTPTAAQARTANGLDSVSACGGNHVVSNYLESLTITPALAGNDANQAVFVLPAAQVSPATPPSAAMTAGPVTGSEAWTDHTLGITASEVFEQLAATGKVQAAITTLLPLLKTCLESLNLPPTGLTRIAAGSPVQSRYVGKLAANGTAAGEIDCTTAITGANAKELARWRDNFWYLTCATPTANCVALSDSTAPGPAQSCDGLLVFSGHRTGNQRRATAGDKNLPGQYLENTLTAFASATQVATAARPGLSSGFDQLTEDVAICLKRPPSTGRVELDNFADVTPNVGGKTLVRRDTVQDILTLGDPTLATNSVPGSAAGCSFSGDTWAFGNGARFYFRFQIVRRGDGFTFALVDTDRNVDAGGTPTAGICGGAGNAGQFLGYASRFTDDGGLLLAPPIEFPKIGLEFDTTRNGAGATGVGDTTNAHLAFMYWGRSHDWPAPPPLSPYEDDNTHGLPPQPQAGYQDPFAASAFGYSALRSLVQTERDFHVRLDIERNYDAATGRALYVSRVWIRRWDQAIPGMDNVSQDFTALTALPPNHADNVYIYDLVPGTEAFRSFRLGFTNAQSVRTQLITVQDLKAALR